MADRHSSSCACTKAARYSSIFVKSRWPSSHDRSAALKGFSHSHLGFLLILSGRILFPGSKVPELTQSR